MVNELVFELLALKAKNKGVLTCYTVAFVIFYVKKMIIIYSTKVRHLFDTADMGLWY